jgi:Fe-S oxidoreductase
LIQNGRGDLVVDMDWIWQCTECGRCNYTCPAGVDLASMICRARGLVPRDRTPGQIQKTADLHRTVSNNMGLEVKDWLETVEWMAEELGEEVEDLEVPIEEQGAEYFATINSKLPMYYPADLQDIFKIFHAAGVDWTLPEKWWEGTNYAMFTDDEQTWEETLRRQAEKVVELGCKKVAYTECGHGYYATKAGYKKFGMEPPFEVFHVVELYARWIREGRFNVDPSRNAKRVTLHDPCNAVRKASIAGFPSIADDARFVLRHVCTDVVEMTPNREANYCCSGGGGALLAGFRNARTYYGKVKVDQIDRTEADLVCTPCVNCYDALDNLARDYDRPWKPVHLWKLLANAIVTD